MLSVGNRAIAVSAPYTMHTSSHLHELLLAHDRPSFASSFPALDRYYYNTIRLSLYVLKFFLNVIIIYIALKKKRIFVSQM